MLKIAHKFISLYWSLKLYNSKVLILIKIIFWIKILGDYLFEQNILYKLYSRVFYIINNLY